MSSLPPPYYRLHRGGRGRLRRLRCGKDVTFLNADVVQYDACSDPGHGKRELMLGSQRQRKLFQASPKFFEDPIRVLGLHQQPRQLVVVVPMLGAITFWFLEKPNHMPRVQHPFVSLEVLPGREVDVRAAVPSRRQLHVRVRCGAGTTEDDVGNATFPVTCNQAVQTVPLLAIVIGPRMKRWLVGERKSCSVSCANTAVKTELFGSVARQASTSPRVQPTDVMRRHASQRLDKSSGAFDDTSDGDPKKAGHGVDGTGVPAVSHAEQGDREFPVEPELIPPTPATKSCGRVDEKGSFDSFKRRLADSKSGLKLRFRRRVEHPLEPRPARAVGIVEDGC